MKKIFAFLFSMVSLLLGAAIVSTTGLDPVYSFGVVSLGAVLTYKFAQSNGLAFSTCGTIAASNTKDCDNLPNAGTRDRMVIMNWEDVTLTYDADGHTIANVVLASGATAYQIDGQNNSIVPMSQMVERGFFDKFDQEVVAKGFDIGQAAKVAANNMVGGLYMVICENYHKGASGNASHEVYGATVGLELVELQREPNSEETEGALHFRFYTRKNKENSLARTLFDTDYDTTKAIVDGLL